MITLVTGNPDKLRELQAIFPPNINLTYEKLDIEEIQGNADPRAIVEHKLEEAFSAVKGPVIVEDVSAGIESHGWLPGPFIKFYQKQLGGSALFKLSSNPSSDRVRALCTMGYKDASHTIIVEGSMYGKLSAPRGGGFGFDPIFVPDGYTQTLGELGPEVKNRISHRKLAIEALVKEMKQRNIC